MKDIDYLKLAIDQAEKLEGPYKFGAVLVKDGEVLAADHQHAFDHNDASAHAEVSVIRAAGSKIGNMAIPGSTLYATHEPCLMCFYCAYWAGVERIVYSIGASEMGSEMYETKNQDLTALSMKLNRKIIIEQIGV